MREFINIVDEEILPDDIETKAHDAAMSLIYNAKANPKTHGHYNVFWYVDVNATGHEMVKIVDLLELGLIVIDHHKDWRKVVPHVIVYPFHEPLSEKHVLDHLVETITATEVAAKEDGAAKPVVVDVIEGRGSIRAMLEQAVAKK